MTVQEVIKEFSYDDTAYGGHCTKEMRKIAIKALEEVEQYRALGTVEELKEAREKQPKTDWIPCEERLPENDEDVLVQMEDDSMMVDFRTASSSGWFWADNDALPIAWQPLPQPYKKDHLGEVNGMVKEGNSNENT